MGSKLHSQPTFGDRAALLADCARRVGESEGRTQIVLFELSGNAFKPSDGLRVTFERRLADSVGDCGSCYRLRSGEYGVLAGEASLDGRLERLAVEATDDDLDVFCGAATLPEETIDPAQALLLADQRLQLQKREQGIEPKPLLGEGTPVATGRHRPPPSRGIAGLFRSYDNFTMAYQPTGEESALKIGDLVVHRGSRGYVCGLSPMSLPERKVELEDPLTGARRFVPIHELERDDEFAAARAH